MTDQKLLAALEEVRHSYEHLPQTANLALVTRTAQVSSTSTRILVDAQRLRLGMVLYPER